MKEQKILIYKSAFVKKDKSLRDINFIRLEDIPTEFLYETLNHKNLKEGMELVWDIDRDDFRIFNWGTSLEATKILMDIRYFLPTLEKIKSKKRKACQRKTGNKNQIPQTPADKGSSCSTTGSI